MSDKIPLQKPAEMESKKEPESVWGISEDLSRKLVSISFFSACGVVLIHAQFNFEGAGVATNWVIAFFSRCIVSFSVPMFFAISGFLLARKTKAGRVAGWYPSALKKRVRTLLVPYLCWCTIYVFTVTLNKILMNCRAGRPRLEYTKLVEPLLSLRNFAHVYGLAPTEYPVHGAMWYIKSLLLLCLLSPLLLWIMRRRWSGLFFLIVMAVFFFLVPHTSIFFTPGFTLRGILFFSIGIFLACYPMKEESFLIIRGVLPPVWVLSSALGAFCIMNPERVSGFVTNLIMRFTVIAGVGAVWCLYDMIPAFRQLSRMRISNDSFFLYAFHVIVLEIVLGNLVATFLMNKLHIPELGIYFLRFLIPLVLSLLTAELLKRFLPRLYRILTGGR